MDSSWEDYVKGRIPEISDIDLLKVLEIADSMVIKGTAATKLAAVDALIAVLRG